MVHLERMPLGTPYPTIVRHVRALLDTPPLKGNAELVVDATGVGVFPPLKELPFPPLKGPLF